LILGYQERQRNNGTYNAAFRSAVWSVSYQRILSKKRRTLMEYLVWIPDEFEGWKYVECEDLKTAQAEILKGLMAGKEPLLTVAVPYDFNIKVKEDKIGETQKNKARGHKGPGAEGEGEVRPGDTGAVPKLDSGSGDSGPGDRVPSK